jgi:hypothetical protein
LLELVKRLDDLACRRLLFGPYTAFLVGEDGFDVTAHSAEPPGWLFAASLRIHDNALGELGGCPCHLLLGLSRIGANAWPTLWRSKSCVRVLRVKRCHGADLGTGRRARASLGRTFQPCSPQVHGGAKGLR